MKRLLCFDLDGTLTQHRTKLEKDNEALLDALKERYLFIQEKEMYLQPFSDFQWKWKEELIWPGYIL